MSLRRYQEKRDFARTPEPEGDATAAAQQRRDGELAFAIQKHAARRLHYDFRLELGGVLKSWAVPKGPSLDPSVKSLAVQVEDHPLEYGSFEGIIPRGQYGGGTVQLWDGGTWDPLGDAAKDLRRGKLKFRLHGEKLGGQWALVQMQGDAGDNGKNWLLIKHDDDHARAADEHDVLKERPESVASGRSLEQIADAADRVWDSQHGAAAQHQTSEQPKRSSQRAGGRRAQPSANGNAPQQAFDVSRLTAARRAPQPAAISPQLPTLVSRMPAGDDWLHELKFDGYRLLAFIEGGETRLITRSGYDWTGEFPRTAKAIAKISLSEGIIDGEIVALAKDGTTDFQALQNRQKGNRRAELVYYAFDLPHLEGYDLTRSPLIERKELLKRILLAACPENDGPIRYSDHIRGQGPTVAEHACRHALEGVVSKRADSQYEQRRSRSWTKFKCLKKQEFVVGGYTDPAGSRIAFGALLLGYYERGDLIYCGRVGTGFREQSLRRIKKLLTPLAADGTPFANPPTGGDARGVHWVEPRLVAEVEFSRWTDEGVLRHPSFQGLREDKPPREVVRERPAGDSSIESKGEPAMSATAQQSAAAPAVKRAARGPELIGGVRVTNPDRVMFPDGDVTKRTLAEFYLKIADWILPHVAGRPLTIVRCPKGRQGECFYQKHVTEAMPEEILRLPLKEKEHGPDKIYAAIDDARGLVALVQMSVLEMHPWGARRDRLDRPDWIVFDLDPGPDVAWTAVIDAAETVRDVLAELDLTSFVRISGGKGLHVVVPLVRRSTWDEVKQFAQNVARGVTAREPQRFVAVSTKAKRGGRIFIDYLRNSRGATSIASYSTRARPGAPVATPLGWDELSPGLAAGDFTVESLPRRLQSLIADPWADFFSQRQSLTKSALRGAAELAAS